MSSSKQISFEDLLDESGHAPGGDGDRDDAPEALPEPDAAPRLTLELERALLLGLRRDWERLNYCHFRNRLKPPVFVLSDATTRLGQWSAVDRTIEIARRLVLQHPWGVVLEVLKHEMAHQFVHEVLQANRESAHGEAFQRICASLGIDPAATGLPTASPALPDEEARVLSRIAKLLALAESSNQHEAENAMREAQRLMLKYNLQGSSSDGAGRRIYRFRHLGAPTGRLQGHQRILASILGSHFFVEVIWLTVHRPLLGTPGTVLEVCGTEANLEMATYVHDFLLHTAERLWQEHKRARRLHSDADRRSFLSGVMRGFAEKLETQQSANREEGLVWVKDAALGDYFDARYPKRVSKRPAVRANAAAFQEGQRAGRGIVLHKPVTASGSPGGPRLLGPRRG